MKSTLRIVALSTLLGLASLGAHAAETADLTVKGVIRPSACSITLSDDGQIDFGNIRASSLNATGGTDIGEKTGTATITCEAPTRVGLTATDDRAGTANPDANPILLGRGWSGNFFGVGSVDGKKVGAYVLYLTEPTADGASVSPSKSLDQGATWADESRYGTDSLITPQSMLVSWSPIGQAAPEAYTTISQPFKIGLGVAPKSELPDLTTDIPIDGLATFTLVYL
ncbi:DUF1120 domain-containing protein [Cupriavidus pauculus]|uniref:DUF1120 domain-containing protein n=1 Tax=Cupriavidus pauculus TaxID=82633 RepID=UPI001FD49469|nr:DUF1120 domain-containing protein [Cupriavidus pauculus]